MCVLRFNFKSTTSKLKKISAKRNESKSHHTRSDKAGFASSVRAVSSPKKRKHPVSPAVVPPRVLAQQHKAKESKTKKLKPDDEGLLWYYCIAA